MSINGFTQVGEILFFNVQLIQGVVDGKNIRLTSTKRQVLLESHTKRERERERQARINLITYLLNIEQISFDNCQMAKLANQVDDSCMVNTAHQYRQQIIGSKWLGFQVELNGFVANLEIGNLGNDILEQAMIPSISRMLDHCQGGAIIFVVLNIQESQF
jgi:hypothetical protein